MEAVRGSVVEELQLQEWVGLCWPSYSKNSAKLGSTRQSKTSSRLVETEASHYGSEELVELLEHP